MPYYFRFPKKYLYGLFVLWLLITGSSYAQRNDKHIFYIYGDSLSTNEANPAESNCIPNSIYERKYWSKCKFIETHHLFYQHNGTKTYQSYTDTFLLKKNKLYYKKNKKWRSFYTTFSDQCLWEKDIKEELKKGIFRTIGYTMQDDQPIAILAKYPLDTHNTYYYFNPEFGIVGIQGTVYMTFRVEPCPVNWLKRISEAEWDKWIRKQREAAG